MQIAIVTGANKGIGYEIAKKLCGAGMKVILACRNQQLGEAATNDLKMNGFSNVEFRSCDIASNDSINQFVSDLSRDYDFINVLVNNAAMAFRSDIISRSS